MTAKEFSETCGRMRLPLVEITHRLGVHRATLHAYRSGKLKVTPLVTLAMKALQREVEEEHRNVPAGAAMPAPPPAGRRTDPK